MNQTLRDRLVRDYPFMSSADLSECGEGWFQMLNELCETIQAYLVGRNIKDFQITQVDQTLGTLNVDFVPRNRKISKIIEPVSKRSASICETCGAEGSLSTRVNEFLSMRVLCPMHRSLYGYEEHKEVPPRREAKPQGFVSLYANAHIPTEEDFRRALEEAHDPREVDAILEEASRVAEARSRARVENHRQNN